MLKQTEQLMQAGIEAKRNGKFREAINFYTKAINAEPERYGMMYISLAKSQYLVKDVTSVDNYLYGLYYQIIEHAINLKKQPKSAFSMYPSDIMSIFGLNNTSQINIDRLLDEEYQYDFLQNFGNTLKHLAHSYVDLNHIAKEQFCQEMFHLLKDKFQSHKSYPTLQQFKELVDYEIEQYAYDLAAGGISKVPKKPNNAYLGEFNFIHIYIVKGFAIASRAIDWKSLQNTLRKI